jgi:hypothetical protein
MYGEQLFIFPYPFPGCTVERHKKRAKNSVASLKVKRKEPKRQQKEKKSNEISSKVLKREEEEKASLSSESKSRMAKASE